MAETEQQVRQRRKESAENSLNSSSNGTTIISDASWCNSASISPDSVSQNGSQREYSTANEYCQDVHQWLLQYHMWQQMNWFNMTFPFYAMSCMNNGQWPSGASQLPGAPASQVPGARETAGRPPQTPQTPQPQPARDRVGQRARFQFEALERRLREGALYKIPPVWKRVAAEFIDFILLFVIKLIVTILTVEYVGIVDIQKYDLDYLLSQNLDYNTAFAMTSELVAMEIINRIFICLFETLCLRKGLARQIGGTTPGKRIMGLRVVSCGEVTEQENGQIRVIPAGNIGLWNALIRSVIKNFSLAFFFPVCFTVFFFQHGRAAYDIISNSIVVEALNEEIVFIIRR